MRSPHTAARGQPPLAAARERPRSSEHPAHPKINKQMIGKGRKPHKNPQVKLPGLDLCVWGQGEGARLKPSHMVPSLLLSTHPLSHVFIPYLPVEHLPCARPVQ